VEDHLVNQRPDQWLPVGWAWRAGQLARLQQVLQVRAVERRALADEPLARKTTDRFSGRGIVLLGTTERRRRQAVNGGLR